MAAPKSISKSDILNKLAEAKEPLLAVAAVLRQIDEWLPRR